METVNLLDFLNSVSSLDTLEFARCDRELVNFLDLIAEDEQFTNSIDLGIIFLSQKTLDKYVIVDGLSRILSLSLLLHAVCECYKKTTTRNDKAIKTIRSKYLFTGREKLKLRLPQKDAELYSKIINGERLSGREKSKPMFVLLHNFWSQIKEEKLHASKIFKMLQKVRITIVETSDVSKRDLYYRINKDKRQINQLDLINDFMKEIKLYEDWKELQDKYMVEKNDIDRFLKDFLITKFNYKKFKPEFLYDNFVNYFETMTKYMPKKTLMDKIKNSAKLYYDILNLQFINSDIRNAIINIKRHDGSDTYAYILSVYEDYHAGNIEETTFIEILNTINEYLKNRQNSGKNIDFNELIEYLNALISFK